MNYFQNRHREHTKFIRHRFLDFDSILVTLHGVFGTQLDLISKDITSFFLIVEVRLIDTVGRN